ncbi:MAG: hypothetical protein LUQ16_00620 [Methanomassiliicoccales archaeon]|jgi:hypothetical protein|nr:hypothetical protein [Methanomassiliicoccales archaeon]MDD1755242.1 hypothetical protein [Methanomassiliicoccales archaeon]
MKLVEEDPDTAISILLKNLDHENDKVANFVHQLLERSTKSKKGMRAVLNNIVNPNQVVRRNAVAYLSAKRGFHVATYASFYEHTYLLIAMARNKEIPVSDIEALVEVSKETYLEGETIKALQDMAASLDFIKHRHRTADTLKTYLTEMLKLAPDLTRMGAYDGQIAEPLRRAINASKNRALDETKEIIEVRTMESSVRRDLNHIGRLVKGSFQERPTLAFEHMTGVDAFVITKLRSFIDSVIAKSIAGKREEALLTLISFMSTDLKQYMEDSKERLEGKDRSALISLYIIGLVLLKLASYLMSQTAEDVYQKYFHGLEVEPSVHVLPWPEPIVKAMI